MKTYDLIVIGTGSGMNIINPYFEQNPEASVAVIDKDDPGGICLTKGCIPSKMLVYPADLVRHIQHAGHLGIRATIDDIGFSSIMARMRHHINEDVSSIRKSLKQAEEVDYYPHPARFVRPKTVDVNGTNLSGSMILLCTGSRPQIPDIDGLEDAGYLTSDTQLDLDKLPPRTLIIGGGYIAAEYGHFLSAMGSEVTIVGRNPLFLKDEEPEISGIAETEMSEYLTIHTGYEVFEVKRTGEEKTARCRNIESGNELSVTTDEILVAAGRRSNADFLDPEAGELKVDAEGWIMTNEFLETNVEGVWAIGDALGKHQFKHAANYESEIVFTNATAGNPSEKRKAEYHAVPHAVFTWPEIAAVGMGEEQAVSELGEESVLIGLSRYGDTAKGLAMGLEEKTYFVKVLLENRTGRILGAHIIGPEASILIQEIVTLMYTSGRTYPFSAMHIHPALSEVVERAFSGIVTARQYREYREGAEREHNH